MKRFIFWGWLLLSLSVAVLICSFSLPIRDDYFPAIQDYISSCYFLSGVAIILSTVTCIATLFNNSKNWKATLIIVLTIICFFLFAYFFRLMLPIYLLLVEAFLIIIPVSLIHFLLTCFLRKLPTNYLRKLKW